MDGEDSDDKILSVPVNDPKYNHVKSIDDLSKAKLDEITHFFKEYKTLEGKTTEVLGWEGVEAAIKALNHSIGLYRREFY